MIRKLLLVCIVSTIVFADESAMRGWYYYEDPQDIAVPVKPQKQQQTKYNNYRQYNKAIKEEFEEIQDRAIYNPTPENIKAYNVALRVIGNNASRFGLLSVTENWQDPKAGSNQSAPNGAGLQMDLDKQRQQIKEIIKRYAIFYFINKDCKYCSVEANELKRLEYTYNVTVRVISMDGTKLEQYSNPDLDHGISVRLKVKEAGELMAFDSTNNQTTVLGFGYIHFDQIIQRLQTLFITGTSNWNNYLHQKNPVMLAKDKD